MYSHAREAQIKQLRGTLTAADAQRYFDQRLATVEQARGARPFLLGFHTAPQQRSHLALDGVVGRTKTAFTSAGISFPLLVLGAITDMGVGATVRIGRVGRDDLMSDLIPAQAFAGAAPGVAGMNMPLELEVPEVLQPNEQLRADVFNSTGLNGTYYLILICERITPITDKGVLIDSTGADAPLLAFMRAQSPRNWTVRRALNFAGGGAETLNGLETPGYNAPLLFAGLTTNATKVLLEIQDSSNFNWQDAPAPVWAFAQNFTTGRAAYSRFDRAVYMSPNGVLRINATNGIRGAYEAGPVELDFRTRTP